MKKWIGGAALLMVVAGLVWGLLQGLQGPDKPSREEITRQQSLEQLRQEKDSLQELAERALARAREDSARAARAESRLDSIRERERTRRRRAKVRAASAGDSLRSTLDSLERVLPEVHRPLIERARAQLDTLEAAHADRARSLQVELAATDSARAAEREAKIRWRTAYHAKSEELLAAEARADTLAASSEYWRGRALTPWYERFAGGYVEAVGKIGVQVLACHPETGGKEECAAAGLMWAADVLTEGLP